MNNEWIPCSERMPNEGEYVLVYTDVLKCMYIGVKSNKLDSHVFISANHGYRLNCTHWMPLPEVPKKELKPCPFCGSEATIKTNILGDGFTASCTEPKCIMYTNFCKYDSKEKAKEAWERRCDS